MHPVNFLLLATSLAACSAPVEERPSDLPQPISSGSPRAPGSAAQQAGTASPVSSGPKPVTPPEKLPVFDGKLTAEIGPVGVAKLEVAASVCAAAVRRDEKGVAHVGCRACPPFDSTTGPDGRVVETSSKDADANFFELRQLYTGPFTRAGKSEGIALFDGCEPHAGNFGGSLVVERARGVWVQRGYRSGVNPERCVPWLHPDGHQLLICRWVDGHQSFMHDMIFSYDFTKGSDEAIEDGWHELATVDTNAYAECLGGAPGMPVTAGVIDDFRVENVDSDPALELVVDVTWGRSKKTAAYNAKCKALAVEMSKDKPAEVDVTKAIPQKKSRLVFDFDGKAFVPDAKAAAKVKEMGAGDNP